MNAPPQGRVAVIPARGGSRRIPRKNLRPFLGQPVLRYPLATARDSGLFDAIIVSTDDEEIAAVAREAGASVPFLRPAALADDHASTLAVAMHAVDWLVAQRRAPQLLCVLYPTAVFVDAADLRAACAQLEQGDADCVFAASEYAHPVQRALLDRGDGRVRPLFPDQFGARTQDLPPALHDAGQFYWLRAAALRTERSPLDDALAYRLPRHRVQDLDVEGDWAQAERLYRLWREPA